MQPYCPSSRCALCDVPLPRGVRIALFASPESDEAVLGDFCSVTHALESLDQLADSASLPDALFLGVRVDRQEHDEEALATIMAEIVRRAVRSAVTGENDETPEVTGRVPHGMLN
jgi:hypothetical protein